MKAPIPRTDAAWDLHLTDETNENADPWGLAAQLERENAELRRRLQTVAARITSGQAFTMRGKSIIIVEAEAALELLNIP